MSEVLLINPRRKRRAHKAKRRVHHVRRNPTRKRRAKRATKAVGTVRRRVRHVMKRVRSRRRSSGGSSMGVKGFLSHTVMPGAVGAAGALTLDIALGYLPIPDTFKTGYMKPVIGLVGALAMGMIASKVIGRSRGAQVAMGAATVVLYNTLKSFAMSTVPTLPLSGMGDPGGYPNLEFYSAGKPVGEYQTAQGNPLGAGNVNPVGMYTR